MAFDVNSLIGSVISGVGGVVSSGVNSKTARRNTDKTIAHQTGLAADAFAHDIDMWNRQNEYNTPLAQIQRYQEAGLNPNLIYGSGTASAGNASSYPTYDAPNVSYNYKGFDPIAPAISAFNDFRIKSAQVDNLQEQNRLIESQADSVVIDNIRKEFDLALDTETRPYEVSRRSSLSSNEGLRSSLLGSQISNLDSSTEYTRARTEQQLEDLIYSRSTREDRINLVKEQLRNTVKRGRNIDADTLLKVQNRVSYELDNELRRLGINPSDSQVSRVAGRLINEFLPDNLSTISSYLPFSSNFRGTASRSERQRTKAKSAFVPAYRNYIY